MNQVFEKTRELGEAIMQSEEYRHMKEIEEKAMQNAEAADTMGRFLERRGQVEELLAAENPDPVTLQRLSDEMDQLQKHMQLIEDIQELTQARAQFSGLIDQVNKVLKFIITGQMDEDEGCSGDCEGGCEGCSGGCHGHALN